MPTLRADKKIADGILSNIQEGCSALPSDGCQCGNDHSDPAPGTARVTLSAWPADGEIGPFTYNAGAAVGNAAAKPAFWTNEATRLQKDKTDLEALKAVLVTAGKSTTIVDAKLSTASSALTAAIAYL